MNFRILMIASAALLSAAGCAQERAAAGTGSRIAIRLIGGRAEFYDRATKERFVVRGNNYIRLAHQRKPDGASLPYHSTFNPGLYDPKEASTQLAAMSADGYNVVRVFLNYCCVGGLGMPGQPLSPPYLDNVADFLKRAQAASLRVIFTLDWLPVGARKRPDASAWCPDFQCTSVHVLTEEGIRANEEFFNRFVRELAKRSAPLEGVLAYELRNELTFETSLPPLALSSGSLTTANGRTYDLSRRAEKVRMLEEGLVHWINRVRAAILGADPQALVTVGFVPPADPERVWSGKVNASIAGRVLRDANLDFIDIHVYPEGSEFRLDALLRGFGLEGFERKPIVLGEFGALTAAYPSARSAAQMMPALVSESCRLGADGWIFWAWDTNPFADVFSGLDAGGMINRALAPRFFPDPCASGPGRAPHSNLASGATIRASRTYEEFEPARAADAYMTPWNSGGEAPQWIEMDLGTSQRIREIRLVVSQTPEGPTRHQVWVGPDTSSYVLLREIARRTRDREVLSVPVDARRPVRFVKVLTLSSPSWVGWREIEIVGDSP